MTIRLVDTAWGKELDQALRADTAALRIISPFIKAGAIERFLPFIRQGQAQVITRFNLADFAEGVSDIAALRQLLKAGASVRGIRNLHAKLYLFGDKRAIITSANLTQAALNHNHEFGMVSEDTNIISACKTYFSALWQRGGADLSKEQLEAWNETVTRHRAAGARVKQSSGLGDYGADAGVAASPPVFMPPFVADARQAYVKFLGEGTNRAPLSHNTLDEVKRAGCHWAVAYPAQKRPSGVEDDAIIYIARLTKEPNDIRVFGRAVGMKHEPGRDDATPEEIARRPWKDKWPRYIRVHHAEFVAGTMENGVSLNELMEALGANSFASTQRNAASGKGNTNPRKAFQQQAAVALSQTGQQWLGEKLQAALDIHGKIPQDTLDALDWPANLPQSKKRKEAA